MTQQQNQHLLISKQVAYHYYIIMKIVCVLLVSLVAFVLADTEVCDIAPVFQTDVRTEGNDEHNCKVMTTYGTVFYDSGSEVSTFAFHYGNTSSLFAKISMDTLVLNLYMEPIGVTTVMYVLYIILYLILVLGNAILL